jgi:hypothetical protein
MLALRRPLGVATLLYPKDALVWAIQRTARGLAQALQVAGAQRAMELDINSYWVRFNFYFLDGPAAAPIRGEKLVAAMTRPATPYLTPDTRDSFYVTAVG